MKRIHGSEENEMKSGKKRVRVWVTLAMLSSLECVLEIPSIGGR